jgi:hypothetical protein
MNPRRVQTAPTFDRAFQKLPRELQQATREAIRHFVDRSHENAILPERKTGLRGVWTFRVTRGIRVFYVQRRDKEAGKVSSVLFHVGQHDDYRTILRHRP